MNTLSSYRLATADGGQSWAPAPVAPDTPATLPLNVLSSRLLNANDGWAAVLAFGPNAADILEETTNGGRTWTAVGSIPVEVGRVAFNAHVWVAVGFSLAPQRGDTLAISTDHGASWTRFAIPSDLECHPSQGGGQASG